MALQVFQAQMVLTEINGINGTNGIDGVDGADGAPGPGWTLAQPVFNSNGTIEVNGTSGSGGPVTSSAGAWLTSGNTATSANYIGTNNAIDFRTFTNGLERMTVESNGRVGIGTTTPDADLHSEGTFRITAGGDQFQKLNVAYETGGFTFLDIHDGNSVVDFRLMTQGDSYLNGDGNVGIGTTTPSEQLDVVGNVEFSGSLEPAADPGAVGEVLMSQGAGLPPTWVQQDMNPSQTTATGKFFVSPIDLTGWDHTIVVADPLATPSGTCFWTWVGPMIPEDPITPGLFYTDIHVNVSAENGQWIFYITNDTPYSFTGFQLSVVAFYGP